MRKGNWPRGAARRRNASVVAFAYRVHALRSEARAVPSEFRVDTEEAGRIVEHFNWRLVQLLTAHPPEHYLGNEGVGVTWLEGACWLLAYGVVEWLGERAERCGLFDGDEQAHVVVRVSDHFIDGDGLSSLYVLLQRWRVEYGRGVLIGSFDEMQVLDPRCDVSADALQRFLTVLHTLPHRDSLYEAVAALERAQGSGRR